MCGMDFMDCCFRHPSSTTHDSRSMYGCYIVSISGLRDPMCSRAVVMASAQLRVPRVCASTLDPRNASLGPLGASLGPRRARSGLAGGALVVVVASQEALWASLGLLECLTSIQRCISLQCLFWVFSCFPPLQCFILVSMLSFTSRVFLAGHLIWPSQSMREVEICLYPHGLDRFGGGV